MTDRRTPRKRLGDFGEDHAAYLLTSHSHTIIARGWRCATGELDLITLDGEELVFVEVRTRRGETHGTPEESVIGPKAARLLRLGALFLQAHPEHDARIWRIDLVAIVIDRAGKLLRVTHHVNAVDG